jgi:hypothetical protein
MDEVLYACRFFQFTAAMVIFGALAFRLYAVPGDDARTAPSVLTGFDAWLGRVTLVTAIVALGSALALLLCQAADMAGSRPTQPIPEQWLRFCSKPVSAGSGFGTCY